jgi:hypothetical protein
MSITELSQVLGTIHETILPTRCSAEISQQMDISIQSLGQQVCSSSGIPCAFSLTFFTLKPGWMYTPILHLGLPLTQM